MPAERLPIYAIVAVLVQGFFGVLAICLDSYPFLAAQIAAGLVALGCMGASVVAHYSQREVQP